MEVFSLYETTTYKPDVNETDPSGNTGPPAKTLLTRGDFGGCQ